MSTETPTEKATRLALENKNPKETPPVVKPKSKKTVVKQTFVKVGTKEKPKRCSQCMRKTVIESVCTFCGRKY